MQQLSKIAKVVINLSVREIDRAFDYLIPHELAPKVCVGSAVLVPFGSTKQTGYVIGLANESEVGNPLPIEAVVNDLPVFNEYMVELCRWIAKYYLSTISEALMLVIPAGYRASVSQLVKIAGQPRGDLAPRQGEVYNAIVSLGGTAKVDGLKELYARKDLTRVLKSLQAAGLVERYFEIERPKVSEMNARYAVLNCPDDWDALLAGLKRAPKQRRIIEELKLRGEIQVPALLAATGATYSSLQALAKRGLIYFEERQVIREPETWFYQADKAVELTGEQENALLEISNCISADEGDVFLLQGVTGSGKTEVYLRSIQRALDLGKSAIVLVPEIALTAQMVARFRARFGEKVAVLHSALGAGERFDQWRGIREGKHKVVVGARSAVFAPVVNLGIIIVDEEHEASYKQGRSPRYNAKEVAVKRAQIEGACVVLGSATPSLEVKWRAETGLYRPLYLRNRIQKRALPHIVVVDMRDEPYEKERPVLGGMLKRSLSETLDDGGKAILFINRRGFSNFILCQDCGLVPKCRNCAVSLTFHSVNHSLRCHHCNFAAKAPDICPRCGSHSIKFPGAGTQRVEAELSRVYPGVPVIRMDADTTARKGSHQKHLAKFDAEKSAILLGTQMIAKGLDFPEVTLVGVINADTSLHLPDFRSAEHTFQLLMQVAGRAGRGEQPGKVIIQTYSPNSYPIQAVLTGDYDSFYSEEIEYRRELAYPPFSGIVRLLFSGREPDAVVGLTRRAAKIIESSKSVGPIEIVGPSPAPLLKVKTEYRWHILLKVLDGLTAKCFLEDDFRRFVPEKYQGAVALTIDVDPVWVL